MSLIENYLLSGISVSLILFVAILLLYWIEKSQDKK